MLATAGALLMVVACSGPDQVAAGLVTDIDTLRPGRVQAFTLRTQDGASLVFDVSAGTDLGRGAFPADHLREHMATGAGVAVAYRTEGDRRIALKLTDADWIGP